MDIGFPDLVEHEKTGLLSPAGDWSALADNVIRLLEEPGLGVRLATQGFEAGRRCGWAAVRQGRLDLYGSMV